MDKPEQSPSFYRPEKGCVVLVTERFDEFSEAQVMKRHLSEKTAKRLLAELTEAINFKQCRTRSFKYWGNEMSEKKASRQVARGKTRATWKHGCAR